MSGKQPPGATFKPYLPAFLLGLLFFFIQLAVMVVSLLAGMGGSKTMQAIAARMGWEMFFFLLAPFLLFLLVSQLMTLVAAFVASRLVAQSPGLGKVGQIALVILLLLWATVLWENTRIFPGSVFAFRLALPEFLQHVSAWYVWAAALALLGVVEIRKQGRPGWQALVLFLPLVLALASVIERKNPELNASAAQSERPNVFLIGIDSLRSDMVGGTGAPFDLAPHLSQWLKGSAVFPLSYTPVARTYPSWMGILSGRYPVHSGARVNLMPVEKLDLDALLPSLFRQNGYKTVYAIDEKRFSNIDRAYGFDVELGPRIGASDFLATIYDDFPLSNILSVSALAPYILPDHYTNRALTLTYQPEDFQYELRRELAKDSSHPLFMVTHFCLPHWPYVWGRNSRHVGSDELHQNYMKAVKRADEQLDELMHTLKQGGYLENAIVVFLSDHGEALGLDSDSPYVIDNRNMPAFYGHGFDLLSPPQSKVVLGVAGFGKAASKVKPGLYQGMTVLIDIAPTVTDMAGITLPWTVDGHSLAKAAVGAEVLPDRPVFMETEFDLFNMGMSTPNEAKLVEQGAGFYKLNDHDRVELTGEAFDSIVKTKKRAVLYQGHILQVEPNDEGAEITLGVEATHQARRLTKAACQADKVCAPLLGRLETLYGKEITGLTYK